MWWEISILLQFDGNHAAEFIGPCSVGASHNILNCGKWSFVSQGVWMHIVGLHFCPPDASSSLPSTSVRKTNTDVKSLALGQKHWFWLWLINTEYSSIHYILFIVMKYLQYITMKYKIHIYVSCILNAH